MEIEVKACQWEVVNIDEVAQLLLSAKRVSPFWNPDIDLNWFRRFIDHRRKRFSPSFVVLAYSRKNLVGMTGIITTDPSIYDLWRWNPVVLPGKNETEIATRLINATIRQMKVIGVHRLEVCFDFNKDEITPEAEAYYQKYRSWHESCGAARLDEFVYMTCKPSDFNLSSQHDPPDGLGIKTFGIQDKEKAYNCFYQAFLGGKDRSFLGRTEEQRRRMFDEYFDEPENLNEAGSLILSKADQVIAFSIIKTRPNIGDEHLAILCVHPDHQGKSLGKQLLALCMSKIAQQGDNLVSLGVDLENIAAYNLYRRSGFETQAKLITHIWKNEDVSCRWN